MIRKWRSKWIADRNSDWNKYVRAKYNCSNSMDLGSDLAGKKVSEMMAGFGLIRAYWDDHDILELETDNVAAEWEWTNSMIHGVPHEHAYVVKQLNQRNGDDNLSLVVRAIDTDSNELAMYLARHGAENYHQMVIIENLFGRVWEIWSNDMGLSTTQK
ncbi:hypothetical protein POM88_036522 [Heracleum sosnowskyi]|uniref:Uncharacterized protein n=1 Tax=Heracleum sosnowskyi TaxID=360622 RepID=A0AAD8HNC1_9APIA|nr:hypothetical protein POM88_036522 [Heracleum sosnowskyi]